MPECNYKTLVYEIEWKCPLTSLDGEEHCFWHKEEDGKEPTDIQLEELKKQNIEGVYLKSANLENSNLYKVYLNRANLQNVNLVRANLQEANLEWANLQEANLRSANFQGTKVFGTIFNKAILVQASFNKSWGGNTQFQDADLTYAHLQEAYLGVSNFQRSKLYSTRFQKSHLLGSNFQDANLLIANLESADIEGGNFQGANLEKVNLKNAKLNTANFEGANLNGTKFDSETDFEETILIGANLFNSYFDKAMSFRNAKMFINDVGKEINEIVGDVLDNQSPYIFEKLSNILIKLESTKLGIFFNRIPYFNKKIPLPLKPYVLNKDAIEKNNPIIAEKLYGKGLIRYAGYRNPIICFDKSSGCVIKNLEKWHWYKKKRDNLEKIEGLNELILKDGDIKSEFLCKESCLSLYKASYEIYNNIYNFYMSNGRLDQASHVHYRRGEAFRKLLKKKGGIHWFRSFIFDFFVLKVLTGYGNKLERPLIFSSIVIGSFAGFFYMFNGIIKNINGDIVTPNWLDYLYFSVTTFTSLGYSNIQPNLAVGYIPQILVAFESGLGVLMMALIIFIITYEVSR